MKIDFEHFVCTPVSGYPNEWFILPEHRKKYKLKGNFEKEDNERSELLAVFHESAAAFLKQFVLDIGYVKGEYSIVRNYLNTTTITTRHFMISVGHTLYQQWSESDNSFKFAERYEKREVVIDGTKAHVHRDTVVKQLSVLYRRIRKGVHGQNQWCDIAYLIKKKDRWFDLEKHANE